MEGDVFNEFIKKIPGEKTAKIKPEKIKKAKTAAAGVAAGVAAGAVGGILLAPKSGKETREDIKNASKQAVDAVSDKAAGAKAKAGDVIGAQKEKFNDSKAKDTKEYLDAKKAVDEACEECGVDSEDVVEALEEAAEALEKEEEPEA